MRGPPFVGLLLLAPAWLAVLAADVLWPRLRAVAAAVSRWPPLRRLRARVGALPPVLALPLFLIPEACSRFGWVASAWLVLHGEPWRALAVYLGTKLLAGSLALWICSACLPVLLRLRWFAAAHGAVGRWQGRGAAWLRRRGGGRFAAALARVRLARLRAGS